jgi:hypothetical protein
MLWRVIHTKATRLEDVVGKRRRAWSDLSKVAGKGVALYETLLMCAKLKADAIEEHSNANSPPYNLPRSFNRGPTAASIAKRRWYDGYRYEGEGRVQPVVLERKSSGRSNRPLGRIRSFWPSPLLVIANPMRSAIQAPARRMIGSEQVLGAGVKSGVLFCPLLFNLFVPISSSE